MTDVKEGKNYIDEDNHIVTTEGVKLSHYVSFTGPGGNVSQETIDHYVETWKEKQREEQKIRELMNLGCVRINIGPHSFLAKGITQDEIDKYLHSIKPWVI